MKGVIKEFFYKGFEATRFQKPFGIPPKLILGKLNMLMTRVQGQDYLMSQK